MLLLIKELPLLSHLQILIHSHCIFVEKVL